MKTFADLTNETNKGKKSTKTIRTPHRINEKRQQTNRHTVDSRKSSAHLGPVSVCFCKLKDEGFSMKVWQSASQCTVRIGSVDE
jgi:hypothetical protein